MVLFALLELWYRARLVADCHSKVAHSSAKNQYCPQKIWWPHKGLNLKEYLLFLSAAVQLEYVAMACQNLCTHLSDLGVLAAQWTHHSSQQYLQAWAEKASRIDYHMIWERMKALLKSLVKACCECFSLPELVKMLIVSQTTGSACLFKSKLVFVMLLDTIPWILLMSAHTLLCWSIYLAQVCWYPVLSYSTGGGHRIGLLSHGLFCTVLFHSFLLCRCRPYGA